MKLVCRAELLTTKMVEDTNPAQEVVHVVHEDASYDKDVVEIKLPDSVVTSDYGDNFVKDVCIDEGLLPPRKFSEEKVVDEKSSPIYGETDCATKSVHELKPEIVLPVGFAPDSYKEKLYSSSEEHYPEGRSKETNFGDISEKKISLQELLRLESAEESQHKATVSSETSKNHMPSLHGEAVGQVSTNACHGIEATASKTSELVNNSLSSTDKSEDCPVTTSEERAAEASPQCSTSAITDVASTEPTCPLEKTVDVRAERFDKVEKTDPEVDALSLSSSDVGGSSEKSNDQNRSAASKQTTNKVDETAVASTSSAAIVQPGDANGGNKHETDDITDAHDSHNLDGEIAHGGAKETSRIGNGYPPSERGLFGPSIMSAPVSHSGVPFLQRLLGAHRRRVVLAAHRVLPRGDVHGAGQGAAVLTDLDVDESAQRRVPRRLRPRRRRLRAGAHQGRRGLQAIQGLLKIKAGKGCSKTDACYRRKVQVNSRVKC